jgi:hypothetical protein
MGYAVEDYEWDGLRIPGRVTDITEAQSSEEPMRNLYRRWSEFMEADGWDELATWRDAGNDAAAPGLGAGDETSRLKRPSRTARKRPPP